MKEVPGSELVINSRRFLISSTLQFNYISQVNKCDLVLLAILKDTLEWRYKGLLFDGACNALKESISCYIYTDFNSEKNQLLKNIKVQIQESTGGVRNMTLRCVNLPSLSA